MARICTAIAGVFLILFGAIQFEFGARSYKSPFFSDADMQANGLYYLSLFLVIPGALMIVQRRDAILRLGLLITALCLAAIQMALIVKEMPH